MIPKRYLGDGVYAKTDRGMIKLTTENGIEATNTIFLEPEVLAELDKFFNDAVEAAKEPQNE